MPQAGPVLDPQRQRWVDDLAGIFAGVGEAVANPIDTARAVGGDLVDFLAGVIPQPMLGRNESTLVNALVDKYERLGPGLAESLQERPASTLLEVLEIPGAAAGVGTAVRGARAAGRAAGRYADEIAEGIAAGEHRPFVDELTGAVEGGEIDWNALRSEPLPPTHPLRAMVDDVAASQGVEIPDVDVRTIATDKPYAAISQPPSIADHRRSFIKRILGYKPERPPPGDPTGPRRSMMFSRGLLKTADPSELRPIIGHELGHYQQFSPEHIRLVAPWLEDAWAKMAPVRKRLYQIRRRDEFDADRRGAEGEGSPHGLVRALRGINMGQRQVPVGHVSQSDMLTRSRPARGGEGVARLSPDPDWRAKARDGSRDLHPEYEDRIYELLNPLTGPGTGVGSMSPMARRGATGWAPKFGLVDQGTLERMPAVVAEHYAKQGVTSSERIRRATETVMNILEGVEHQGMRRGNRAVAYEGTEAVAKALEADTRMAGGFDPVKGHADEFVSPAARTADEMGFPRSDPNHPINVPRDNLMHMRRSVAQMISRHPDLDRDLAKAVIDNLPDLPHGSDLPVAFYKPWRDAIMQRTEMDEMLEAEYLGRAGPELDMSVPGADAMPGPEDLQPGARPAKVKPKWATWAQGE